MKRRLRAIIVRLFGSLYSRMANAYHAERRAGWQEETKRKFGHCGDNVRLRAYSSFICPDMIKVGDNVHIGENAWFRADGGLEIGDNTIISRNCVIFTADHNYSGESLPLDNSYIKKPVCIGRNVWIGMNVMIIKGVTIGDGAIVGLGTVVVEDVPPLAIVGSYGQRVLKYRDRAHYERLDSERCYLRDDQTSRD